MERRHASGVTRATLPNASPPSSACRGPPGRCRGTDVVPLLPLVRGRDTSRQPSAARTFPLDFPMPPSRPPGTPGDGPGAPAAVDDAPLRHDAFISYSRKNEEFARGLEQALERYAPPRGLAVPRRRLDIFRDSSDFTGGEYHQRLEQHLSASAKLIVVCSPEARGSAYVNDEIRCFARLRGVENIVPVLLAGVPNNEAAPGQPAPRAFPDALCELMPIPLAIDFRGFDVRRDRIGKGTASDAWYNTLASIYGVSRDEIEQRDEKRRARARRTTFVTLSAIIAVLSVALYVAVQQRAVAESRLRENQQLLYVADIDFAQEMYQAGNFPVAREVLDRYGGDRRDLAGFEWHYLNAQVARRPADPATAGGYDTLSGHGTLVAAVAFSPDGRLLASGGMESHVRLWDVRTARAVDSIDAHPTALVTALAFSATGGLLASGSNDSTVSVWDTALRRAIATLPQRNVVTTIAFSPRGPALAVGGRDPAVMLCEPSPWRCHALTGHTGQVMAVGFSPDGRLLASTGYDNTVRLWNVASRKPVATLRGHDRPVFQLAFSPDGRSLYSGSLDSTLTEWNVRTRKPVGNFTMLIDSASGSRGTGRDIRSLAVAANGRTLAVSSENAVELWDVRSQRPLLTIPKPPLSLRTLVFSPDGRALAGGGQDGTVWLWHYDSGR